MTSIMNDIVLPQDRFVHVINRGRQKFEGVFGSKLYVIEAGDVQLMNYHLYTHFSKLFDGNQDVPNPLQILQENEGSLEFAKANAKRKEQEANDKIDAARKAAGEAEQAKKDLLKARADAKALEPVVPDDPPKDDGKDKGKGK